MRLTRFRPASLFVCVASVLAFAAVAVPSTPAAGINPHGKGRLLSISCVSRSLCRATVRSGLVERWNGHKWQPGYQFANATSLDSISCPTKDFCAAVESVKLPGPGGYDYRPVTRNADGTWDASVAPVPIPHNAVFFGAMSCTSASFCIFVDSGGDFRRWDGTSWTTPVRFQSESRETMVSCASSNMCKAVDDPQHGKRPVYTWNGSSWSVQRVISRLEQVEGLSCPSVSFCMLVRGLHYNILSGSHISSRKRLPNRIGVSGLSCTSRSFCIGTNGGTLGSFRWDGKSWHGPHELTGETYLSASCSSPSFCGAVSFQGDSLFRVDGTWRAPHPVQ